MLMRAACRRLRRSPSMPRGNASTTTTNSTPTKDCQLVVIEDR